MNLARELVETWNINDRLNRYLLGEVGEERLKLQLTKGKTVDSQFAHIHNVRLMWLKASAPDAMSGLEKLERGNFSILDIDSNLTASGIAIANLVEASANSDGKVKGFKPHVTAFVGYMIAHEANHRAQVEVALRQAGTPLSDKTGYGLWEWGVR